METQRTSKFRASRSHGDTARNWRGLLSSPSALGPWTSTMRTFLARTAYGGQAEFFNSLAGLVVQHPEARERAE